MYRAYSKRLYLTWVLCLVSSTVLGTIFHICCFIFSFIVSDCKDPWYKEKKQNNIIPNVSNLVSEN